MSDRRWQRVDLRSLLADRPSELSDRRSALRHPSRSPSPIRRPSRSPIPIDHRSRSSSPIRHRSRSPTPIDDRSPSSSPILPRSHSSPPILPRSRSSPQILPRSRSPPPIHRRLRSPPPILPQSHTSSPIRPRSRASSPIPPRSRSPSVEDRRLMLSDQRFPHANESFGAVMMSCEQFLQEVKIDISLHDSLLSYEKYKEAYIGAQKHTLFDIHKDENWLKNMYHPTYAAALIQNGSGRAAKDKIIASYYEIFDVEKQKKDGPDLKYICRVEGCSHVCLSAASIRLHIRFHHQSFVNELIEKMNMDLYFENYMKDPNVLKNISLMQQRSLEKEKANFEQTLLKFNIKYMETFNNKMKKEEWLRNKHKRIEAAESEFHASYKLMSMCQKILEDSGDIGEHLLKISSIARRVVDTQRSLLEIENVKSFDQHCEKIDTQILLLEEQVKNLRFSVAKEASTVGKICEDISCATLDVAKVAGSSTLLSKVLDDHETDDIEKHKE